MRSYAWSRTAASTTQAGNHLGGGNLKDDDGPAEEGIEDNKHEDVFSCPTVPFSPHGEASLSDHGGATSSEKSVIKAMTGQGSMKCSQFVGIISLLGGEKTRHFWDACSARGHKC